MSVGYQDIKLLARNFDEFQLFSKTSGELAKIKYIKYLRMKHNVYVAYKEKIRYVHEQDYENASAMRDEEVSLARIILKDFYK